VFLANGFVPGVDRVCCVVWICDGIGTGDIVGVGVAKGEDPWLEILGWTWGAFANGLVPCGRVDGDDTGGLLAYDTAVLATGITDWRKGFVCCCPVPRRLSACCCC